MHLHWMFNCEQVSIRVSESMDRKLPLLQRMMIRFHLAMCRYCSRFQRQLQHLRRLGRISRLPETEAEAAMRLPDPAADRIKQVLQASS
jgi:hypothetical protein